MRQLLPTPKDDVDPAEAYDDPTRQPKQARPYVLVNMVASTDGAFTVEGRTAPLSSKADRDVFHLLRSFVDVVLVGAQTVRVEGYGPPKVTDEWRTRREQRGQAAAPRMAVVTRHLDLDPQSKFFKERPFLLVPADADPDAVAKFEDVADVVQAGEGSVDLRAALAELRRRGVATVLCEGGPTLNGELARAGAIDELCLTVAPELVGGSGGAGLLGRVHLEHPMGLDLVHELEEDDHLFLRYRTVGEWPPPAADDAAAVGEEREETVQAFHRIVAGLDYPMLIVTAFDGKERSGCLVGFATQCSIDPPRYLVCISKQNHTSGVALGADVLVVHVPSASPDDVEAAELFGTTTGDQIDKFERCQWHDGPGGAPVLDGIERWFAGSVMERFDAGDHTAYLLMPIEGEAGDDWTGQLGFQAVKDLEPGHPA